MKEEALEIFQKYSLGFTRVEGEKDYWEGECPFCGSEDGFKAWGDNEYFLCLDCQIEGNPEDFMRAMKMGQSEGEEGNKLHSSIISSILTLNLPGRELQIILLLHLNRNGMTAREVSEKLQVPQSNIHRYLAAVEEKRLVYSEGKPKRYFKIDDPRLIQKYCRGQ
ncbi:MAG: MarR family transcriptional regulator [Candidatus Hodarchaeota archaeon]